MNKMLPRFSFILLTVIVLAAFCLPMGLLTGCGGSDDPEDSRDDDPVTRVYAYDFDSGGNGWVAGFADLPANPGPFYELASDPNALLPESVRGSGTGGGGGGSIRSYRVVSHNRSDDVFSFLKRQVGGLVPGARYQVTFSLTFASDAPENSVGIGGSPGSGVVVKAGTTAIEPDAVPQVGRPDFLRMNLDIGDHSSGGTNAKVMGTVGIPGEAFVYTLKTLTTPPGREVSVTADGEGRIWLIVGTDSGFEGRTDLYYTEIAATLTPL
ncbi:MAG: hypothetical protein H7145_13860 [Akkermansiaceae bacterium]|nr:hypothetical protein [Armatimonadota bacterium]